MRVNPPEHPVVDSSPSMEKVTWNFNAKDYAIWLGVTGFSIPLGYFGGELRLNLR
jgi:hypothetical protein